MSDETKYASILDRLTEGRELPGGTDRWALKATDFAGRTRNRFQWPSEGWVDAPGPFSTNDGACPSHEGDGICVATTHAGLASGGHRALALLLVAYASDDVLGGSANKVRVKRARVVERLDGEWAIRKHGTGANLSRANLSRANLSRANLSGANLSGADLCGANLSGANLYGADLSWANLYGADLSWADLSWAELSGAELSGAELYGAELYGADLGNWERGPNGIALRKTTAVAT